MIKLIEISEYIENIKNKSISFFSKNCLTCNFKCSQFCFVTHKKKLI